MYNYFIPSKENNHTPHLLSRNAFIIYIIFAIVLNSIFTGFGIQKVGAQMKTQSIVNAHNRFRTSNRLEPLTLDARLSQAAKGKAELMIDTDCWSHFCKGSPGGIEAPWGFFDEAGFKYIYAGENLGEGFTTVDGIITAWINSQTHRDNMLNPNYTHIGVAILEGPFQGKADNTIVVIHFGTPSDGTTAYQDPGPEETFINIEKPVDSDIVKLDEIQITGAKSTDIDEVELYINNDLKGSVTASGSNFTFRPKDLNPDQSYEIKVKGRVGNEVVGVSKDISIVVSDSNPILTKNNVRFKLIDADAIQATITPNSPLAEIRTNIEEEIISQVSELEWRITVFYKDVNEKTELSIIATDQNGKAFTLLFDIKQIDKLMETPKENSFNDLFSLNFANDYFSYLKELDFKSIGTLAFIAFLLVLFMTDYIVLRASNMLQEVNRKSHLQIAIFGILFLLINAGSIAGSIYTIGATT